MTSVLFDLQMSVLMAAINKLLGISPCDTTAQAIIIEKNDIKRTSKSQLTMQDSGGLSFLYLLEVKSWW